MKVPGVYIIWGPLGIYVGQSHDCFGRHELPATLLGWDWGIAREMPGSTKAERCRAEREVADSWASRGWTVVSRNTTGHQVLIGRSVYALSSPATRALRARAGGLAGYAKSLGALTSQERVTNSRKGVRAYLATSTPAERSSRSKNAARALHSKWSSEQRSLQIREGIARARQKKAA